MTPSRKLSTGDRKAKAQIPAGFSVRRTIRSNSASTGSGGHRTVRRPRSAGLKPGAPERLRMNPKVGNSDERYSRWIWYPKRKDTLANWIEDTYQAFASRAHLIVNPRDRFKHNRQCL
jgi:hypothetical protein